MTRVLILGATGVLGQAVADEFENFSGEITVSTRPGNVVNLNYDFKHILFDALTQDFSSVDWGLSAGDFIINCIGLIKSHIDDSNQTDVALARRLNFELPFQIAELAENCGAKVIQIATDCVFSGSRGAYSEADRHDPADVYGISKSKGEVASPNVMILRCSIVGPENRGFSSLYEWVRSQPKGASITGFTNHLWNGITNKAFAKIALGIIREGTFKAGVQHITPANQATKDQLVRLIAAQSGRTDLDISSRPSQIAVNRTLKTDFPAQNTHLWLDGGYPQVPTIEQLIQQL